MFPVHSKLPAPPNCRDALQPSACNRTQVPVRKDPPRHELWSSHRRAWNLLAGANGFHTSCRARCLPAPCARPHARYALPPDTLAACTPCVAGGTSGRTTRPGGCTLVPRQPASFLPFQVAPFRNWPVTTKRIELVSRPACCSTPRPSTPESWQPGALENYLPHLWPGMLRAGPDRSPLHP